ncbi:hypothetical protein F4680DRAFT_466347 [Xylaria scruposa]|nr:hypothetical protein F4680DRAFT_466347 [Xylaria scruposa]
MPANQPYPLGSHLNDIYEAFRTDMPESCSCISTSDSENHSSASESDSSSSSFENKDGSEPETISGRCEACENDVLFGLCESCQSCQSCTNTTEDLEVDETDDIPAITDISTWAELQKYLTAYHWRSFTSFEMIDYTNVRLTCDICQTKRLRLPSWIDRTADPRDPSYVQDSEDLCILPCGHFFGYCCIKRWMDTKKDGVPCCPKCRFVLLYPECEHLIRLRAIKWIRDYDADDLVAMVPNTRKYVLDYDGSFRDISPPAKEIFDAEVNFGVPDDCDHCALRTWQRVRRQRALW